MYLIYFFYLCFLVYIYAFDVNDSLINFLYTKNLRLFRASVLNAIINCQPDKKESRSPPFPHCGLVQNMTSEYVFKLLLWSDLFDAINLTGEVKTSNIPHWE